MLPWSNVVVPVTNRATAADEFSSLANELVHLLKTETQALVVDALADRRLYEQELARTREENTFLQDQVWLGGEVLVVRGLQVRCCRRAPTPASPRQCCHGRVGSGCFIGWSFGLPVPYGLIVSTEEGQQTHVLLLQTWRRLFLELFASARAGGRQPTPYICSEIYVQYFRFCPGGGPHPLPISAAMSCLPSPLPLSLRHDDDHPCRNSSPVKIFNRCEGCRPS